MSLRRFVSLMHGLGYSAMPKAASIPTRPREPLSSPAEVSRFFGGALRYAPGVNDG
jgi:hypothetical protein